MQTDDRSEIPENKNALASKRMQRRIVDVSVQIVGDEGFSALTVGKLSQRAGISKGALYHHFDSLSEVRRAVLNSLLDPFTQPDAPASYNNFETYLSAVGCNLFDRLADDPVEMRALYAFVAQALVDEAVRKDIRLLIKGSLSEYTEAVRHFFPGLSHRQVETTVLILDAYFCGLIFHWYLLEDSLACHTGWDSLKQILARSLDEENKP